MRSRLVPGFRKRGRAGVVLVSTSALLAFGLLLAPVEMATSVDTVGRVLPAQEWVLVRTQSGAITATLRNYGTGAVSTTFAAEPARGDAVRFELEPVGQRESVRAGEVVGSVASGEAALRLSAVRGRIAQAEAELRLRQAGAKPDLVEAERQDVRRAQAAREQARLTAFRQRALSRNGLASDQQLADAESEARLAEAELAAAQARLRAARAGDRPEEAAVVRAQIEALRQEAASLVRREAMGTLASPISGRVSRVFSPDTLLLVSDTSAYQVLLPLRWSVREVVGAGSRVTLEAASGTAYARIVDVRAAPAPRTGQAYLIATADVVSGGEHLVPGLLVPSAIETAAQTPLQVAGAVLGNLFSW